MINSLDADGGSSLYVDSYNATNVVVKNADGGAPHNCDITAMLV
jgi:hypothetical protein